MTKVQAVHPTRPDIGRVRALRSAHGSTLAELLLVVVVLGILAAIVVFALGSVTSQAAVAACKADAATVDSAISAYNVETGGNPAVTADALTSGASPILRSFPSSPNYSITIQAGIEMVAAPKSATPVAYGTDDACSAAGTVLTSTVPGLPTTTTTTLAPTTTTTVP